MIKNLPAEIIVKIFNKLGTTDLLTVSVVCKRWREIALILIVDKVKIVVAVDTGAIIKVLQESSICYKHWLFKCLQLKLNDRFKSIWDFHGKNAISISLVDVEMNQTDLRDLISESKNLEELHLGSLGSQFMMVCYLDNRQKQFSDTVSKLRKFHLTGSSYLSDAIFAEITSPLKSLENFSLSDCQISYQSSIYKRFYPPDKNITASEDVFTFNHVLKLIKLNASTLKQISFGRNTIDNASLLDLSLVKDLKLDSLELVACNQLTRVGVCSLLENQKNLTTLNLSNCARITDYSILAIVENIPKIRHLNVSRCRSITELGLVKIRQLKNLEWLDISRLNILNPDCIHEALGRDVRLPLRWLNCAFLNIPHETVFSIARTAPNLQHLDLSMCANNVFNRSIQSLCKLKYLSSLDVSGCASVSDFGFSGHTVTEEHKPGYDSKYVPRGGYEKFYISFEELDAVHINPFKTPLQVIAGKAIRCEIETVRSVKRNDYITSQSGSKLSDMKVMRKLNLSGCTRLGDLTLTRAMSFRELNSLNLSHCPEITDWGLMPMLTVCCALEELWLDDCTRISDYSILVIAHRLRRLKTLSLNKCINLTDDAIDTLSNCAGLRYLDVSNCYKITHEKIQVLQDRLPLIWTLKFSNIRSPTARCDDDNGDDPIPVPTPPPLLRNLLKILNRW